MNNSSVNRVVLAAGAANIRAGVAWLNKLIVAIYKLAGFVVLTAILLGLGSYIARSGFFFVNRSWIVPAILSPSDDRIRELNAELAEEMASQDELEAELRELAQRLDHEERILAAEQAFQEGFAASLRADLEGQQAELRRMKALGAEHRTAAAEILSAGTRYAELSRERLDELFAAKIIDVDGLVGGTYQRAQIAQSGLSLKAGAAGLDARIAELSRRADSLGAVLDAPRGATGARARSYEVLQKEYEYRRSCVEAERARAAREAILESIAATEMGIARIGQVIQGIKDSPYLTAVDRDLTVAFVPYENLDSVAVGSAVYRCRVLFVWCEEVGHVREVLGGEVQGGHPLPSRGTARGRMVRVELTDAMSARDAILHVGRPPVFL